MPVGASGQFPINRALLAALSVGFACFNQTLFWLLAILLTRDSTAPNAPANAERFMWASLALGTVVWAALGLSQIFAGARRPADHCVLFAAALLTGYSVKTAQPSLALGANTLLAAWALRGLGRKKPIA
ncbi:MAG: hypothetical protein EAZ36_05175 [Verrucomicrobia bacterium]|nr:MAG: hypothetical protein EAZ36_05175 [Verrucomicrobiota bacterium]